MDITIHATFLRHDGPDASLTFYRDTLGLRSRYDVIDTQCDRAVDFPGFPFVFARQDTLGRGDPQHQEVTVTGSSTQGVKTLLHPVSDLETAKALYTALLGVPPQTDDSYYVGFDAEGQHIGLVPGGGPQGMTSPVAYWHVQDIEAKLAEVTAAGATVKEPARDVGGGRLVATVTDPDGNVLGLLQDR